MLIIVIVTTIITSLNQSVWYVTESKAQRMVKIMSFDGAMFDVPESVAFQSAVIRYTVELAGADLPVPVPIVTAEILSLAFQYCTKHADFAAATAAAVVPANDAKKKAAKTEIENWDKQFVDALSMDALYDLIVASNYLNIQELLDLCCERVAGMIRGKSAEEVRATFDIVNDFSPDEEDELITNS